MHNADQYQMTNESAQHFGVKRKTKLHIRKPCRIPSRNCIENHDTQQRFHQMR